MILGGTSPIDVNHPSLQGSKIFAVDEINRLRGYSRTDYREVMVTITNASQQVIPFDS